MDLIDHYPDHESVFIGFFMMNGKAEKGIATQIITELCEYLHEENYKYVQLAWVKGNPQAEHFLDKKQISGHQGNQGKYK